jgi:hypothetical protein
MQLGQPASTSSASFFVSVVRMAVPRRVEVYESGKDARTVLPGGVLDAPGILQNAVPVEALYDRDLRAAGLSPGSGRRGPR